MDTLEEDIKKEIIEREITLAQDWKNYFNLLEGATNNPRLMPRGLLAGRRIQAIVRTEFQEPSGVEDSHEDPENRKVSQVGYTQTAEKIHAYFWDMTPTQSTLS